MSFMSLLQAAPATAGSGSMLMSVLPFVLIFVIFYFFLIRPQNKKQKEQQKMIDALKKGDKVITIGGIHGIISSTKEQSVIVKVDENVKIEFNRSAIASVILEKTDAKNTAETKKEDSKSSDETAKNN